MKANYKSINLIGILCLLMALSCPQQSHAKLVGKKYSLQLQDTAFKNPYIDIDEVRTSPSKHRYIHGGFDNGTKFSLYLPTKAKDFTGRFFQYVTPFPDSETVAQNTPGTYFVALRVTSQRNGKDQLYTPITNIDRVRVVVK
ncbi:MAG: hypothetical protein LIP03_04025 [Bacteroidales bacterium]|nr:hypothetical protein [Bacteroidales bacterium]